MEQHHPKISVITPSLNQGRFIRDAIESVLNQRYDNFEHIVIDGGSTDETIEILKSYSHLKWVSEPDRGQSDAINKGFSAATGDIVTWLNSDDWYAEGVFREVAKAYEGADLIIGKCHITDGKGNVEYTVQNVERGWLDILKYWVPYSIPTQPAIFIRRDLLESVAYGSGEYLDTSLHYCMDYDLWLRIWRNAKRVHLDKVFCYYRMYEDNKTSDMKAAEPEMSRVFRRHASRVSPLETDISIIVLVDDNPALNERTVKSLTGQSVKEFEVVAVGDREGISQFLDMAASCSLNRVRAHQSASVKNSMAFYIGDIVKGCKSRYAAFAWSGTEFGSDYVASLINTFFDDRVGAAISGQILPSTRSLPEAESLLSDLFSFPASGASFCFRRVLWEEIPATNATLFSLVCKRIICGGLFGGWSIAPLRECSDGASGENKLRLREVEAEEVFHSYIVAQILLDTLDPDRWNAFAYERLNSGLAFRFGEDLASKCRLLMEKAPHNWQSAEYFNRDAIENLLASYPSFAPLYYYKALCLAEEGNDALAGKERQAFERLKLGEGIFS